MLLGLMVWTPGRGNLCSSGRAVFTKRSCSCLSYGKFLQFSGRARQGIVATADFGLCSGEIDDLMTVQKWIFAAELAREWELSWSGKRCRAEFRSMKCPY